MKTEIKKAWAMFVKFDGCQESLTQLHKAVADHKAEVRVELDGEVHEFTFKDFKERLGFKI
jgi:hypothetical protein